MLELKDLVVAVKHITEWFYLGIYLSLPLYILDTIKAERLTVEESMREMLKKWLDYDPEASWEKLASALEAMGARAVADSVRSHYVKSQAVAVKSSCQHVTGPIAATGTVHGNTSDTQKQSTCPNYESQRQK